MGIKLMQCKDIADEPILRFLKEAKERGFLPATYGEVSSPVVQKTYILPTVADAIPAGIDDRLQLAKMAMLIRRGLVDGCTCGCRGDFVITTKGIAWLSKLDAYHAKEADDAANDLGKPANA